MTQKAGQLETAGQGQVVSQPLSQSSQHLLSFWQVWRSPLCIRTWDRKKMQNKKKGEDTVPALKGLTAFLGMQNVHIHIKEGFKMYKNDIQMSAN